MKNLLSAIFTISDLVGVRVEDPMVFEVTHGLITRLAAQAPVDGLRIDHIDGLRDPLAYLGRLVDPDNRQPVDFAKRVSMLATLKQSEPGVSLTTELSNHWEDGRIKLYAAWKALNFRRERPELFSKGDFVELKATGPYAEHIFAILRHHKREWVLLAAPRWLLRAREGRTGDADIRWQETAIQLPDSGPSLWENIFTTETISLAAHRAKSLRVDQLLNRFPVALLSGGKSSPGNH